MVDYLQLMRPTTSMRLNNRVQEVSEITQGLKALAKDLDLPVLALSQLSRAVEQRDDKRPQLADLRESGSIEQDADVVMFIFREQYYLGRKEPEEGTADHADWQERMAKVHNKAEIIIAKQRHGPTGKVDLYFNDLLTKFDNLDTVHAAPEDVSPVLASAGGDRRLRRAVPSCVGFACALAGFARIRVEIRGTGTQELPGSAGIQRDSPGFRRRFDARRDSPGQCGIPPGSPGGGEVGIVLARARHGAMLARGAHPLHRTMVRGRARPKGRARERESRRPSRPGAFSATAARRSCGAPASCAPRASRIVRSARVPHRALPRASRATAPAGGRLP